MPFEDPNNVSENPYANEAHFVESAPNTLTAANEDLIYSTDWENPELATQAQASNPPITILDRSGGYATIRLNQTLHFSSGIFLQGQLSGTIPPGATLRGRDANNNGIPDIFETLFRQGKIHFVGG